MATLAGTIGLFPTRSRVATGSLCRVPVWHLRVLVTVVRFRQCELTLLRLMQLISRLPYFLVG